MTEKIHVRKVVAFCEYIHQVCTELKEKGIVLNAVAISGIIAYNTGYGSTSLFENANNPMGVMIDPGWGGGVYRSNASAIVDGKWASLQLNYKRYMSVHQALTDFCQNILPSMAIYPELLKHMDPPHGDGDHAKWIELLLRTYNKDADYYIAQVQKRAVLVAANRG